MSRGLGDVYKRQSIYCFVLVGLESPAPTPTELGAAFWPRIILVLMIILLIINIISLRKNKEAIIEKINFATFFKSKLFIGMIIIAIMTIIMPYTGFITACFLFLASYGLLLGETRIKRLIIFSLVITLFLYIVFQGLLDIRLERGISIFRNLALSFEGIILNIKRGL